MARDFEDPINKLRVTITSQGDKLLAEKNIPLFEQDLLRFMYRLGADFAHVGRNGRTIRINFAFKTDTQLSRKGTS